jgi:hypothetical protein
MPKLPTYPWFDVVPDNLKTRNQLAELNLKPGGEIRALVEWKNGKRVAYLYDVAEAVPKPARTTAQLQAVEAAKRSRRTCPVCRRVLDYILNYETCKDCYDYNSNGTPRRVDGVFEIRRVTPYREYQVWLPRDTPIAPYAAPLPDKWTGKYGPYAGKQALNLLLSSRDEDALTIPNHTHTWYYGPWFDEWIHLQPLEQFLEVAEQWPIVREWACTCVLPKSTFLDYALAGLDEKEEARLRTFHYVEWSLWSVGGGS